MAVNIWGHGWLGGLGELLSFIVTAIRTIIQTASNLWARISKSPYFFSTSSLSGRGEGGVGRFALHPLFFLIF